MLATGCATGPPSPPAFDNASTRVLGGGHSLFVVKQRPLAVCKDDRKFVTVESLPPEIQEASPDRTIRSVIRAPDAPDGRLECIWGDQRPALFIDIDRGAQGWYHKLAAFFKLLGPTGRRPP